MGPIPAINGVIVSLNGLHFTGNWEPLQGGFILPYLYTWHIRAGNLWFSLFLCLPWERVRCCGCLRPIPRFTRLGDRFDGGTNGDGGELAGKSQRTELNFWGRSGIQKVRNKKRNPQGKMMKVPEFMYFRYFSLFLFLDCMSWKGKA